MDLSETIVPKSDQLNADDLIAGPRTVTISEVRKGTLEQPVDVVLAEFGPGRPFKPSKSMRRVLVAAWGSDSSVYVGRRMTIYRDPAVKFGGDEVGGIRISHLSDIAKPLRVALTVTRGKRAPFTVDRLLPDTEPGRDWAAEISAATTDDELMAIWGQSPKTAAIKAQVATRHAELAAPAEDQEVLS